MKPFDEERVSWARWSLVYVATYLLVTGAGFLLVPASTLNLLFATGTYGDPMVQFVGAFMIALGTLVVQIIRLGLSVLYPTTVGIRVFFVAVIGYLYVATRDPLFIAVLGVVCLGVALTVTGLVVDAARGRRAQ